MTTTGKWRVFVLCGLVFGAALPVAGVTTTYETTLSNGMKLIVRPDSSSRVACVDLMVGVGADVETRSSAGLRLFLQRAMLRGSKNQTGDQLAGRLAAVGARLRSAVWDDFVEFYALGTADQARLMIDTLAEIVTEPRFDEDQIESVRTQLVMQHQQDPDTYQGLAYQWLRGRIYQSPEGLPAGYGLPVDGFEDSIRALKPSAITQLYRSQFAPSKMTLVIVADGARDELVDMARAAFGDFKRRPAHAPVHEVSAWSEPTPLVVQQRPVEIAWLVTAWPAPDVGSEDYAAAAVAAALLGQGMGSRLYRDLREDKGDLYEVNAVLAGRRHGSELVVYAQVAPPRVEQVKESIIAHFDALRREPAKEEELRRARNFAIGSWALGLQRVRDRAWQLGRLSLFGLGWQWMDQFPQQVRRVTGKDVQELANRRFTHCGVAVVLPESES